MTKIQKIQEIIREYESGVDADITVEEVLNGIKNTIEDDDRYYDREIASTTPTPADEIIRFGELVRYTGNEEHVVLPDSVDQIGRYAFKDSRITLKSVVLPDSIRIINDGAFENCINLEHITLSKNTEYIGRCAFAGLHSLKEIELPEGLKKIAFGAFQSCPNLTGITIPDSVQSIGNSAFFNCGITSVSIPAGCDCDATAFDRTCDVTRRNSTPKQSNKQTRSMKI